MLRLTGKQNLYEHSVKVPLVISGPGIPKGQRERIFGAFERVSNQLTDGVTGTGIGLSIARHLARLHGGDLVLAEAGGGDGCRFILTLETPEK